MLGLVVVAVAPAASYALKFLVGELVAFLLGKGKQFFGAFASLNFLLHFRAQIFIFHELTPSSI